MIPRAAKARPTTEYRKFVEAAIAESDEELRRILAASPLAIGSERFVQWVRELHGKLTGKQRRTEDITLRRRPRRLPADRVIQIVCRQLGADRQDVTRRQRDSLLRPITARMLCRYSGLTQRQTGELLTLSTGAAVSMQLKTLATAAEAKRTLRRQLTAIEKAIDDEIDRESEEQSPAI